MVRSAAVRAVLLTVFVFLLVLPGWPQSSTPSGDVVAPKKEKPGLFEFATKRVNANDLDYGQCIDEARRIAIEDTIQRGYFWSNVLTVALSCFLLAIVIHQRRVQINREQTAATVLAQYHNALTRANSQITEATSKNHSLMQLLMGTDLPLSEAPRSNEPNPQPQPRQGADKRNKTGTIESPTPPSTAAASSSASTKSEKPGDPDRPAIPDVVTEKSKLTKPTIKASLVTSDVDLVAKVNSLQQQLAASQEREKQLRRQLNSSEVRLQKEQQKNQTLKSD